MWRSWKTLMTAFFLVTLGLQAQSQPPGERLTAEEYIAQWKEVAVDKMKQHGIPASITLAQGLLESGNGNSTLARQANNHFGIKCTPDWTGGKVYHDDDKKDDCFRKYRNAAESFEDHSRFLMKPRYADLFTLRTTDYKGWAHGLKKAGYATDPRYPQKLIELIERYELNRLDEGIDLPAAKRGDTPAVKPGKSAKGSGGGGTVTIGGGREVEVFEGRIKFVRAKEGDTFEKVARDVDLTAGMVARWNDLDKNARLAAGQRVYIQPKRNKAAGKATHTAKEGESLWGISQQYGVKLSRLAKYNGIGERDALRTGQVVHLRKPKR
jgi:LysM repeat protein